MFKKYLINVTSLKQLLKQLTFKPVISVLLIILIISLPVTFAEINIAMEPYKEVNVIVKKRAPQNVLNIKNSHIYDSNAAIYKQEAVPLAYNEEATLTLVRYKNEEEEADFRQFIIFNGTATETTIKLIPGKYKIDGYLILNENTTIPPEHREFCIGIQGGDPEMIKSSIMGAATGAAVSYLAAYAGLGTFGVAGLYFSAALIVAQLVLDCVGVKKDINIEGFTFSPTPVGGVSGNITITRSFLDDANTIVFYVFYFPPPKTLDEFAITSDFYEFSSKFPKQIQPHKIN